MVTVLTEAGESLDVTFDSVVGDGREERDEGRTSWSERHRLCGTCLHRSQYGVPSSSTENAGW